MNKPKLDNYRKALATLEDALKTPPSSLLERDGTICRFKFCVEISWMTAKKFLEIQKVKIDTPRNTIKEMAKMGWIDDSDNWIEYLKARKKTSHLYHEEVASELFALVPNFLKSSLALLKALEAELLLNTKV